MFCANAARIRSNATVFNSLAPDLMKDLMKERIKLEKEKKNGFRNQ